MLHEIIVPELAESTVEATVASWLKKDGEVVSKGDVIIELDTDKVSLEIVAPSNGIIQEVNKSEGEVVKVGDILGIIDDSKSAEPTSKEPKDEGIEKNDKSEEATHGKESEKPVNITPVAKKIRNIKAAATPQAIIFLRFSGAKFAAMIPIIIALSADITMLMIRI